MGYRRKKIKTDTSEIYDSHLSCKGRTKGFKNPLNNSYILLKTYEDIHHTHPKGSTNIKIKKTTLRNNTVQILTNTIENSNFKLL